MVFLLNVALATAIHTSPTCGAAHLAYTIATQVLT